MDFWDRAFFGNGKKVVGREGGGEKMEELGGSLAVLEGWKVDFAAKWE